MPLPRSKGDRSLGDEIELKLAVTPSDLVKIRRAKSMLRNQLGDRKKADVVSVYYDTPARVLKGMALASGCGGRAVNICKP
jgi:inorganic triphosphatase YgiF